MSDPAIPEPLRRELVGELMDARRAVGAAKRASDPAAERRARDRVHTAKVALGERGPTWWDGHDADDRRARVEACLVALLRARGEGAEVGAGEAARAAGGGARGTGAAVAVEVGESLARAGRILVHREGAGAAGGAPEAVLLARGPDFDGG